MGVKLPGQGEQGDDPGTNEGTASKHRTAQLLALDWARAAAALPQVS